MIFSRRSRSSSRKSHPNSAASRMSLSGATSNRTITPGSLNWRAPRYTNSTPSVVFPVPVVPATSVMFPRGIPPKRTSSSPLIPVFTRSGSGMGLLYRLRAWSNVRDRFGLATARKPKRTALFESVNDGQPAFSGCRDSQERREPSAERAAASRENVEARGTGRVRGLSQQPSRHQGLERSLDLWKIIPDVLGQALALEEGLGMSIEEQQQIEIARVLQAPDTVEKIPDSLGRHPRWRHPRCSLAETGSMPALSRNGKRPRKSRPVRERSSSVS